MKKIAILLYVSAILALLPSCTHNNGDIGPWFGQWQVERLTVDGVDDPQYANDTYFCFQSSVFAVRKVNPDPLLHSSVTSFGVWKEENGYLHVEFNTRDSGVPTGLHMAKDCQFRILKNDGKGKVLELVTEEGEVCTYYLKSW